MELGPHNDSRDRVLERIATALERIAESKSGQVAERLGRIEAMLGNLIRTEALEMAKFDDLIAKVQEETSVIAGVGVFIQGLRDQIANGATPAQLDQALAAVQSNEDSLKAFTENTGAQG